MRPTSSEEKGAKGAGRMRAPLHDLRYSSPEVRSAKPVLRVSTKALLGWFLPGAGEASTPTT
jgi:hypothetical protein